MRRRLLYHASAVTVTGYKLGISEFSYPIVAHNATTVSPIFRYYYIPEYSDGTEGERVYISQEDETPDFLYVEFTLNSESDVEVKEAGTKLDAKTGVLTFNEWSDYINNLGGYRMVAMVDMHVGYAPNGSDRASADFPEVIAQQASINIYWHTPVVTLSYDDAPAQPEEEGGKIILKPTVKWTQEGYDDDGNLYTQTSERYNDAQYVFSSIGDITVDVDGNVTVPSSTVESRHNVGTVTVGVTHEYVSEGEQTGYANYDVYQKAYTVIPEDTALEMDVILVDNDTRENYIVSKDEFDYNNYPKDKYTPVGIVVIPRDHNVYNDANTIGVLSLMDADMDNPTEGGVHGETIHGNGYINIEDGGYIPYNVENNKINENYIGTDEDSTNSRKGAYATLFPSDMYSGLANTLDEKTLYSSGDVEYGAPSPYDNNGNLNSLYISNDATNESYGLTSPFKRFDGDQSTIEMLHYCNYISVDGDYGMRRNGVLKDDSVWRTSSKIDFYDSDDLLTSNSYNYCVVPAMEACWRYTSKNTHEGNWHLPSVGEWGYVVARANAINNTLKALNSMYDVSYSEIIESGYINCTPYAGHGPDDELYVVCNFDSGFIPTLTNKKGIARPIMQLKASTSNGNIGCTPLPNSYDNANARDFLNDNRHKSRWCIYRNENACNNEFYPSYNASSSTNCISGTVYGVLVKSDSDMTILKTDVELFSFDNLTCTPGRLNRQYGYYNQNIEAGWYVIQKIEWDDGTTTDNIPPTSVVVGNTLLPTDVDRHSWYSTVSVIYNYRNESNLGYDKYTDNTSNSVLSPFRIGYWDNATAILLHSANDTDAGAPSVYDDGKGNGYGIERGSGIPAYMIIPSKTINLSDDAIGRTNINTPGYEPDYDYIAVGEPLILNDGDTVKVSLVSSYGGVSSLPVTGANGISLYLHQMNTGYTLTTNKLLAEVYSDDICDMFPISSGVRQSIEYTVSVASTFGESSSNDKTTSRFRLFLSLYNTDGNITISNPDNCMIQMSKE